MIEALVLTASLFAQPAQGQPNETYPRGADDAYLPGSTLPFYGRDHGGWTKIRRFFDHKLYGRQGQHALLSVLDGRPEEAVKSCESWLAADPNDLESLFCLCVARCAQKDYAAAMEAMKDAVTRGLPFERFLAGPRDILKPLRDSNSHRQPGSGFSMTLSSSA